MEKYPQNGTPCGANLRSRCASRTIPAPVIIHSVAFPTLSTRAPKRGVKTTVKNGIMVITHFALSTSIPKRGITMAVPNFLNEMMQQ